MGISADWRAELYGVRCLLAHWQVDLEGVADGVNARAFGDRGVRCPRNQRSWLLRRGDIRRAAARNLKIIHFLNPLTTLTREGRENSCASGQTWYRKGTELVLTGRKLYGTCTKSVLVGMTVEQLGRLRTKNWARHAVPLRLLDKRWRILWQAGGV